jgi:methyltransferase (TIGR00027 family)
MVARTRFFDQETLRGMTRDVRQVVIVGAGYDGRPLRFRQSGVRFFEVDHPATQVDKRRRLESLGVPLDHIQFVPIDLMTDRIEHVLPPAGHRRSEASLFLCEGLLLYLSKPAVESLLAGLRSLAAPDSRLVLTSREGISTVATWFLTSARQLLYAAIGEPRRSAFRPGETASLLNRAGWTIAREQHRWTRAGNDRLLIAADPGL